MTAEERLALTRPQAAAMCNLTPAGFDAWVKKGVVPGPIPGTRRWSKTALERALAGEANPIVVPFEDEGEAEIARWKKAHAQ